MQHAVSNLALWKESDSRGSVDAMGYSRPQLTLLLLLAAIALTGLGVREWRAGFPDAAERLDRFDREDPPPPIPLVRPRALPGWSPARVEAAAPPRPAPRERASEAKPAATAPADPRSLDLNRASVEHREGPRRRVDERERVARFDSPDNLRGVLGLGPKKPAALREYVTVGE